MSENDYDAPTTTLMETYHPGTIQSRHSPIKDATKHYTVDRGYCPRWAKKVEEGDFITCGNTGNSPFCYVNGIRKTKHAYARCEGEQCCCFVTGEECYNKKLKRRWSCCGRAVPEACVMDKMRFVEGCTYIHNLPNISPHK